MLHIPGHSKGSLGILTGNNDLIAGDTLENRRKPHVTAIISDEAELAASIERLKKLNIQTVYPGHGAPFPMSSFIK